MYVSNYLNINSGHANLDFVDVFLNSDNKVFIDPCLIEKATDPWSQSARLYMNNFFDCLFKNMREYNICANSLLAHSHEQNATKLGYGNGENGRGKTAQGLRDSFSNLSSLVHNIPTITRAQDIPVLVEGFAEDFMSDLLTNILHAPLNSFTSEQMKKYERKPDTEKAFWTWNCETSTWEQVIRPCWLYKEKELLLVPKWIVRKNYLFKAHQYLFGVIIERIKRENNWDDLTKTDIWSNMVRNSKHWEYDAVIDYTIEHPETLSEYHSKLPKYYNRAHGCMSDEDLDQAIYIYSSLLSA